MFESVTRALKLQDKGKLGDAFRMLKMLALKGDTEAMYQLSRNIGGWLKADEAAAWFDRAAERGHFEANQILRERGQAGGQLTKAAALHESGDFAGAVKLWKSVAEGSAAPEIRSTAAYNLGLCTMRGEGMAADTAQAVHWFELAQGLNPQYDLAKLLKAAALIPRLAECPWCGESMKFPETPPQNALIQCAYCEKDYRYFGPYQNRRVGK